MGLLNGRVNGGAFVSPGSDVPVSLDSLGGVISRAASQLAAIKANVYMASMQAAAALGTALTATMVTLALYNPLSSGKILNVLRVGLQVHSPPGGIGGYVLGMVSPPAVAPITNTAALTRRSDGTATAGVGLAFTAATLGAVPTVIGGLGAIAATGYVGATNFRWDGGVVALAPGSVITVQGLTTASTGIVDFVWEELSP